MERAEYGDESLDTQSGTEAEIRESSGAPLSDLRSLSCGVSQVSHLPSLFTKAGSRGDDSRRAEGELVVPCRAFRVGAFGGA